MKRTIHQGGSALRGWTMAELLIALAIASLLSAGLTVGAITLQKSFIASRFHMDAQAQQMRLMDYMSLDLRRALTVNTEFERLTLTIPDYYDSTGEPREPVIEGGLAVYGSDSLTVRYYKDGATVYRSEGASLVALATDVEDFKMNFQDLGQSIRITLTFLPKFQFDSKKWESMRTGTTSYTTTLLRNKRQSLNHE